MSSEFSNWDAGQGILALLQYERRFPRTPGNRRTMRRVRQNYRLHHDRYYKPLIHKGGKP